MASLGSSIAYDVLINILANEYSIDEIQKAKEELEDDQELLKYVKEDEIERVKENLNTIFESLSKINKSFS
jgi:vacuolar-type H+-ATPase subunit I/STV1